MKRLIKEKDTYTISNKNFGKLFNFIRENDEKFRDFINSLGENAYTMTGGEILDKWFETINV